MIFRLYILYNKHKMIKIGTQNREISQVLSQVLEYFICRLYIHQKFHFKKLAQKHNFLLCNQYNWVFWVSLEIQYALALHMGKIEKLFFYFLLCSIHEKSIGFAKMFDIRFFMYLCFLRCRVHNYIKCLSVCLCVIQILWTRQCC